MSFQCPEGWAEIFRGLQENGDFRGLIARIDEERRSGKKIYPAPENVFHAFQCTRLEQVKVVIVGQDPYHGPGQAHGLAFSVPKGVKAPPSLRNILREMHTDLSLPPPEHGCLEHWARQGVLLLNTVLTVEEGKAHSHQNWGWERFTDDVIAYLGQSSRRLIFVLWGAPAQKKLPLIDTERHAVLTAAHPSPLSAYRGFLGCRHFSKINALLCEAGEEPIDWRL